jgi:hypothetical protein
MNTERGNNWFSHDEYFDLIVMSGNKAGQEHFNLHQHIRDMKNYPYNNTNPAQHVKEVVIFSETLLMRLDRLDTMSTIDEYESFKGELIALRPAEKSFLRAYIKDGNAQAAIHLNTEMYLSSIPRRAQLMAILA